MSKIISLLPRHYIGTAAEIAGITGVCGDTAYSSDTDVYYHWDGTAWAVGGISYYVPLPCAAPFKGFGDFVKDNLWHADGLDLTPICPVGSICVKLRLHFNSTGAGHIGRVRTNATTNDESKLQIHIQAAGVDIIQQGDVNLDADRLLDYFFNAATTVINLYVAGYYIRRCL